MHSLNDTPYVFDSDSMVSNCSGDVLESPSDATPTGRVRKISNKLFWDNSNNLFQIFNTSFLVYVLSEGKAATGSAGSLLCKGINRIILKYLASRFSNSSNNFSKVVEVIFNI